MWGVLSTKHVMTLPNVNKLWLMLPTEVKWNIELLNEWAHAKKYWLNHIHQNIMPASLALFSTAPDLPMFSLPAKSTKFNFPIFSLLKKTKRPQNTSYFLKQTSSFNAMQTTRYCINYITLSHYKLKQCTKLTCHPPREIVGWWKW